MERINEFGVIIGPKQAEVHKRPVPEIKDHEILVKLNACNICTSDYGLWAGTRTNQPLPQAGGHEDSGVIIEKGRDVKGHLNIDDQVAFTYPYCGVCNECRRANTFGCQFGERFRKSDDGYYGDFGYARYKIIDAKLAVKLSSDLTPGEACYLEPMATVVQGIKRLRIKPLETVVVIGAGTMGLLNAQTARAYGARVIVTEMMEKKLNTAKGLGFKTIDVSKNDPIEAVKDLTEGQGTDSVILAVGATVANAQALKMIKKQSSKILFFAAGYPDPELELSSNGLHYGKMELIGAFGANSSDFIDAADMLNFKAVDVKPLLEASYPLEDIQKAYEHATQPGMYRITVAL